MPNIDVLINFESKSNVMDDLNVYMDFYKERSI